jgi:acetyl-CoA carboxylase biotin carboxylase subunit
VIIKAAGGGGGRGMRVVHTEAAWPTPSHHQAEAKAAFGNDMVYMEKFLENPRHVEIQVLADGRATRSIWASATARCSAATRRWSKKRPRPASPSRHAQIGKVCVEACMRIGYRGAGTFEFLYEERRFYFIEMNTRIQVEHPVTELVTGVDMVREQLLIAAGHKLSIKQDDVQCCGPRHRVPHQRRRPETFMPSPGLITTSTPPAARACASIRTSTKATACRRTTTR